MNETASWIDKRPDVCGGDARIRDTRYTVWGIEESRRAGLPDGAILARHPELSSADLDAASDYARQNANEIERALWLNQAAMVEWERDGVDESFLLRGCALGIADSELRAAFDPPLPQATLEAARRNAGGHLNAIGA